MLRTRSGHIVDASRDMPYGFSVALKGGAAGVAHTRLTPRLTPDSHTLTLTLAHAYASRHEATRRDVSDATGRGPRRRGASENIK